MENRLQYLAHKTEDREQTVLQHLTGTSKLSEQFSSAFGKGKQGEMAGYLHDIGKYSRLFQERIQNPECTKRCDHSTAGAIEAFNQRQLYVAMCILGHHGGLLNMGGKMDASEDGTVLGRLRKGMEGKIPDYSIWKELCPNGNFEDVPEIDAHQTPFERYMEIKMLYSSLVDADFLDTENFMEEGTVPRGGYDNLEQLKKRLENYLENKKWLDSKAGINGMRTEILETASEQGRKHARGIYTLTVPTGGGKTISSLRFALHHGVEHGLERIIYVIPYVNIIEQTAEKFREILGSRNVLEHHSNVIYEEEDEQEQRRFQLASENWDATVIVTTAVQFFESLFHNKPSRCRKLHNIANSVIIYDEVQMLPVSHWVPCIHALEELSKSYRTTQVLCTATQPAVEFPEKTFPYEIIKEPKRYFGRFKRVAFRNTGLITLEEAAERIEGSRQVLCIVNTKRTAQSLYHMVPEKEGVFHLTTMMIPVHRKEVLKQIKERLKVGKPCKVIATSLVEAGVDLDFPYVMREQAGLDSILQAAGRCNRNGSRNSGESITEVFELEGRIPLSIRQQVDAARYVMRQYEEWDSLEAIEAYFKFWRELRGKENLDQKRVMEKVNRFAFREIAEVFRFIENDTYTVYIPWREDGEELINRLRYGFCDKALFRALGRYGVNVFELHYRELVRLGNVELINGIAVLTNRNLYHEDTGLEFQTEEGIAIFC